MWAGKKVLVTGGAGFIGSHLVEALLDRRADVTVMRRSSSEPPPELNPVSSAVSFVRTDLRLREAAAVLAEDRFEFVFHLAANTDFQGSINDPFSDLEQNTTTTLNMLEVLRASSSNTKFILASTGYVFSGSSRDLIGDDDPTFPPIPYGVSKLAAERYTSVYSQLFGIRSAVVRIFSVYGPRLRKQIVYDFMRKLRENPDCLEIAGTGRELRDMSYVSDIVGGLLLVAERGDLRGEAYNLASGTQSSTKEIAELVIQAMRIQAAVTCRMKSRQGDAKSWISDTSRIRSLGYRPKVNLKDGISTTVDWFESEHAAQSLGDTRERKTT